MQINPFNRFRLLTARLLMRVLLAPLLLSGISHGQEGNILLAVMEFHDNTGKLEQFAEGLPDMLITDIVRSGRYTVVERSQVQEALKSLKLESSGLTKESKMKLGEWLGADQLLVGVVNESGGGYRVDARVFDVATGEVALAAQVSRPAHQLHEIAPALVKALVPSTPATYTLNSISGRAGSLSAEPPEEMGEVQLEFTMIPSLFTQRPAPFQRVRIYLDGRLAWTSAVIAKLQEPVVLYHASVPVRPQVVRLEHGAVDREGRWVKALDAQPKPFTMSLIPGEHLTLQYKMVIGSRTDEFTDYQAK
jgi:TolB-like protein